MKPSERLAKLIAPVAKERFRLAAMPEVEVDVSAGLGSGVKWRARLAGIDTWNIESNWPIGVLLKHVADGGRIVFDHNGSCHKIRGLCPHEMPQRDQKGNNDMTKKATKAKPTREQLAALAAKLADAPAIGNDDQGRLWDEIGGADGWAAMDAQAKTIFRARISSAA